MLVYFYKMQQLVRKLKQSTPYSWPAYRLINGFYIV